MDGDNIRKDTERHRGIEQDRQIERSKESQWNRYIQTQTERERERKKERESQSHTDKY